MGDQMMKSILPSIIPAGKETLSNVGPELSKSVIPGLPTVVCSGLASLGIDPLFGSCPIDNNVRDIIAVLDKVVQELNN